MTKTFAARVTAWDISAKAPEKLKPWKIVRLVLSPNISAPTWLARM